MHWEEVNIFARELQICPPYVIRIYEVVAPSSLLWGKYIVNINDWTDVRFPRSRSDVERASVGHPPKNKLKKKLAKTDDKPNEIKMYQKQPAGWGTALAVKHISKKKVSGAVAPCIFGTWNGLKFCRAKRGSFQHFTWYLQCFQCLKGCSFFLFFPSAFKTSSVGSRLCQWRPRNLYNFHCAISTAKCECLAVIGLTTPFLRVLHELEMAPLEIFHIPSIPPVCTSNWPQFLFFLIQKMPLLWLHASWFKVLSEANFG